MPKTDYNWGIMVLNPHTYVNLNCQNWPYTEGIIMEVLDAFEDGSKALVVAGTIATDTRNLAQKVMQGTLHYESEKSFCVPSYATCCQRRIKYGVKAPCMSLHL